ncbi:hypothetical protein [Pseudopedobacter saltans]|uniref:hypothetical protein n=1 Tax=Pseudopedobacter saltans TaxID=151895 RepID=UPI0001EBCA3B|nr:hypothetical protein [Pseudopedobacter saltans]
MSNHLKESDLQSIAKQLSNPTGVEGIQMGEIMNESNAGMITSTIKTLNLVDNQSILELGHGNCSHLADILNSAKNLEYAGLEISDTMHQQASEKNSPFLSEKIRFELYDGINSF